MSDSPDKSFDDEVFAATAEYNSAELLSSLEDASEPGTMFAGRYEIKRVLGQGGFATVYKAKDANLGRQVALKILRPERLEDPQSRDEFIARFRLEAKIIAKMDHEHIIPVYDCNIITDDGQMRPYIAMKYLEGRDLEEVLQEEGALSPEEVLKLTIQALRGLKYVHNMGVVHKDLKPSNFFITQKNGQDHLYLMDFGIAHDHNTGQGRMTQTGHITGTPQYIAPEYALQGAVTPAIDVYQMGLILCEMYTGQPIFGNDLSYAAIIAKHIKGEVYPPDQLVGTSLGQVIEKALKPDAIDRYADAGEMLEAIEWIDPRALKSYKGDKNTTAGIVGATAPTVHQASTSDKQTAYRTNNNADATTRPAQELYDPKPVEEPATGTGKLVILALLIILAIGALSGIIYSMLQTPTQPTTVVKTPPKDPTPKTDTTPNAPKWTVLVESQPAKAKVFYQDKLQGFTPHDFKIEGKQGQTVSVTLKSQGYQDYSKTFVLGEKKTISIQTKLVPNPDIQPKVVPKVEPKTTPKTTKKVRKPPRTKTKPKTEPKTEPKTKPKTTPKTKPKTEPKILLSPT